MHEKALLTVVECAEVLSLSRTTVYEEMANGRLRSVRIGRARRVSASAIAEYVEQLETEARISEAQ